MSEQVIKESLVRRIGNEVLVAFLKLVSKLPFWWLYRLSDFLYVVVRYVVRYRYKVIEDNLKHAFPNKSEKERKEILRKFYRHFCDFSLESIKMYSMTDADMTKRLKVVNLEEVNAVADKKISVIILGFHYSNWEWGSAIQRNWRHQVLGIYNPLRSNLAFEQFILDSRKQWGGIGVPVQKSARMALEYANRGEPAALWLAADQSAPPNSKFWTYFLNREAPFFSGPEKIAIKTNQPVFFLYIKRLSRGYYEANFSLLINEPAKLESKDIMLKYIQKMEEIIHESPEYYLWSHRRWKHTRPEGIELTL